MGPLNYFGNDPIRSNNIKFNQLYVKDEWDVERLNQILPPVIVHQIMDTQFHYNEGASDQPIWILTSSGNFTCSSSWDLIRPHRSKKK